MSLLMRPFGPLAATNNVGDVAAKEEVWEVAAQVRLLSSMLGMSTCAAEPRPLYGQRACTFERRGPPDRLQPQPCKGHQLSVQ